MKIGKSFVIIISHPFQTVLFALDIIFIDFDLSRMLLSSTVIPKFQFPSSLS